MAESSYNSKGNKWHGMTGRLLHNFCAVMRLAIKNTVDKYERYCSSIAYRILEMERMSGECLNDTWMKLWSPFRRQYLRFCRHMWVKSPEIWQSTDMIICMLENAVGTVWISR